MRKLYLKNIFLLNDTKMCQFFKSIWPQMNGQFYVIFKFNPQIKNPLQYITGQFEDGQLVCGRQTTLKSLFINKVTCMHAALSVCLSVSLYVSLFVCLFLSVSYSSSHSLYPILYSLSLSIYGSYVWKKTETGNNIKMCSDVLDNVCAFTLYIKNCRRHFCLKKFSKGIIWNKAGISICLRHLVTSEKVVKSE